MTEAPSAALANGTTETTSVKASKATSKLGKLFALAGKAERKTFTIRREVEGATVAIRLDGFPKSLDADGVKKLAIANGGKLAIRLDVGHAGASGNGNLAGAIAGEFVENLTGE